MRRPACCPLHLRGGRGGHFFQGSAGYLGVTSHPACVGEAARRRRRTTDCMASVRCSATAAMPVPICCRRWTHTSLRSPGTLSPASARWAAAELAADVAWRGVAAWRPGGGAERLGVAQLLSAWTILAACAALHWVLALTALYCPACAGLLDQPGLPQVERAQSIPHHAEGGEAPHCPATEHPPVV